MREVLWKVLLQNSTRNSSSIIIFSDHKTVIGTWQKNVCISASLCSSSLNIYKHYKIVSRSHFTYWIYFCHLPKVHVPTRIMKSTYHHRWSCSIPELRRIFICSMNIWQICTLQQASITDLCRPDQDSFGEMHCVFICVDLHILQFFQVFL